MFYRIGIYNGERGYVCGGTLQEVVKFIGENIPELVVSIGQLFGQLDPKQKSQFIRASTPSGWRAIIMMEDSQNGEK